MSSSVTMPVYSASLTSASMVAVPRVENPVWASRWNPAALPSVAAFGEVCRHRPNLPRSFDQETSTGANSNVP